MMRIPIPRVAGLVAVAALALAADAGAQSVALLPNGIQVRNLSGPTVNIDDFGTINLGSNGSGGNLRLRDGDGTLRVDMIGGNADLFLGGGDDDGDIVLRDTDGVTTTVNLQGEFGFVQLGSPDEDGDLRLWDNDPADEFSINLDGATGNVTNQFAGNGLVKAWARVNANGSVHSCWRCDPGETYRDNEGVYFVEFSPLGADIRARPRLAVLDSHAWDVSSGQIDLFDGGPPGQPQFHNEIGVYTRNSSGERADRGFTLLVF